jgi:phosphoglycolate phosphatase-like HAD superfamily hydrolase
VIDIDNTLIDTAFRKQQALKRYLDLDASIESIRSNYELIPILGAGGSLSKQFFTRLDTEQTITECQAPSFPEAPETVELLRKNGIDVLFMTARHSGLQAVTISELKRNRISCQAEDLLMADGRDQSRKHKIETLRKISTQRVLVTMIGDRPEDIEAIRSVGLPGILFKSTLQDAEVNELLRGDRTGTVVCNTWSEIAGAVQQLLSASTQMAALRESFTTQYAAWLGDLDSKMTIVVALAAVIVGFCSNELRLDQPSDHGRWLLLLTLIISAPSTIYAIRGFTSRYSSGKLSAIQVQTNAKQWLAILCAYPKKWLFQPGDAIADDQALRSASEPEQASAHLKFFYDKYQTHNPTALLNLRMMELRATNYSKVYAERIASKLLLISIILVVAWALQNAFSRPAKETLAPTYHYVDWFR